MFRPTRHPLLWFLGAAVTAATVSGHVRLLYPSTGAPLFWSNPSNVSIVVQSDGSDDISDGSEVTAIRNAVAAWNGVNDTTFALVEDTTPSQQARRDFGSSSVHLVMFDETNETGYFPGSSGVVALTPITFLTNGQIVDADVLFNGKNFAFTTNGQLGRFDVQDVATHELGHLLGLDHSGCAGATMYPYVDSTVILHRSLSIDDVRGVQSIYPSSTRARILGTVVRSGTSNVVAGAHIVARDGAGRFAGATLTNSSGNYTLSALEPGTYTVYADPLDFPTSSANLGGGQSVEVDFETGVLGVVTVAAGAAGSLGTQTVDPDVSVSLGRVADDYPLRVITGTTVTHLVRGSGLLAGSTLTASDPSLSITSVTWFGTAVQFDVTVPAGEPLGHVDLEITNAGGDFDILTGGLEITPPNPTVASVSPALGAPSGGTAVTISGTGFRSGARVVVGDQIYADGLSGGCTVVDANTITLTTAATMAGSHDVVVIDASGVEGRGSNAFDVVTAPSIDALFPVVGSHLGGTTLTVSGTDFVAGTTVEIDGVSQSNVTIESPTELTVVTNAGVPGGPYVLELRSPSGHTAQTAFSYVNEADPEINTVSPSSGPSSGGTTVTIRGTGFDADTVVVFGADRKTGLGGQAAASLTLVDSTEIVVQTPAMTSTQSTVLVRDSATAQASVESGAFTFIAPPETFGEEVSFGCVANVNAQRPRTAREWLDATGWLIALLVIGIAHRRHGA